MKKDEGQQVHFTDVLDENGEKIGEVKYDGYRTRLKFTALAATGYRLGDCATRRHAEVLVRLSVSHSHLME